MGKILAIFTGKGLTKDKYDALIQEVGWKKTHPKGAIVHIASFDDAGELHVADVWESAEEMNHFVETRLMPVFKKMNLAMPEAKVYAIHNIDAFGDIDAYKVQ